MKFEGIVGVENRVVPALHHAGAARPRDGALAHHGNGQLGRVLRQVQHAHQAGTAAADDRHVRIQRSHALGVHASSLPL
jgi:hypothetical protein